MHASLCVCIVKHISTWTLCSRHFRYRLMWIRCHLSYIYYYIIYISNGLPSRTAWYHADNTLTCAQTKTGRLLNFIMLPTFPAHTEAVLLVWVGTTLWVLWCAKGYFKAPTGQRDKMARGSFFSENGKQGRQGLEKSVEWVAVISWGLKHLALAFHFH